MQRGFNGRHYAWIENNSTSQKLQAHLTCLRYSTFPLQTFNYVLLCNTLDLTYSNNKVESLLFHCKLHVKVIPATQLAYCKQEKQEATITLDMPLTASQVTHWSKPTVVNGFESVTAQISQESGSSLFGSTTRGPFS